MGEAYVEERASSEVAATTGGGTDGDSEHGGRNLKG